MNKLFLTIFLLIFCVGVNPAYALYGEYEEFGEQYKEEQPVKLILPAGSFYRALMGQTVSSEFNNNGDIIKLMIPSSYSIDNRELIPKYSMFIGVVNNLEKAQRGQDGYFSIDIIGLVFPDGRKFDVKGYVPSAKKNKVFGGAFARRSGHKSVLHRATPNGRLGVLELKQNGPRIMGKETKVQMGQVMNVYIKDAVNLEN